jgi:hypothetical protein
VSRLPNRCEKYHLNALEDPTRIFSLVMDAQGN